VRHILIWFFGPALAALYAITLAGLFAPIFAPFDLINHLRLHFLETAGAMVLLFALLRARLLALAAFLLALVNLVLAAPAFVLTAKEAEAARPELTVVVLNVWGDKAQPERVEAFLRRQRADIVLLLEADAPIAPMLDRLEELYPHRVGCIENHLCRMALLSRRDMGEAYASPRTDAGPPSIVAQFDLDGSAFTFYGVHVARPFRGDWQRRDLDRLTGALDAVQGPVLLAGDFNATPWSWALTRFALKTGMLRGRTLGATWPVAPPLFPQFLIDHVMARGGIRIVDVKSGPEVGSDHLPTIAGISLR